MIHTFSAERKAVQWERLVKLALDKKTPKDGSEEEVEAACRMSKPCLRKSSHSLIHACTFSEIIITLLVSFPALDLIPKYLEHALDSGLLPLPAYISTLSETILSSPELQAQPALWPPLISMALKAHQLYSTDSNDMNTSPPVVLYSSKPARNAETIETVINWLRLSYAFPAAHAASGSSTGGVSLLENIVQSLTTLLVLLLSAISSPSHGRLPSTASSSLIQSVTEFAETYPSGDAKLALEGWVMSFSLASGTLDMEDGIDDLLGTGTGLSESKLENTVPTNSVAESATVLEEDLVAPTAIIRSLVRDLNNL